MYEQSNPIQKLRVTVRYGLERSVTRVKSYGSLRCVYKHRNTVTTPEPLAGRYEGREIPDFGEEQRTGLMGKGVSDE